MAPTRRRILGSVALFLVLVMLGAGGSLHSTNIARAQNEDANAGFDPVSPVGPADPNLTVNPPRLYAGDLSHALPARADLDLGTNGYCVTLKTQGITPFVGLGIPASQLGFSLLGTNPIDPNAAPTQTVAMPGTLRPDGTLTSVAGPKVLPTANGDKYCVVARAPIGYKTLRVMWDYNDAGGAHHTIILNDPTFIPVVTVTLKSSSIGNSGLVCTVGWDPTFLTGRISNTSLTLPDPINVVQENPGKTLDWSITQVSGGTVSIISTQPDVNDSSQWCLNVSTAGGTAGVATVTLHFDAVYNRRINTDDQQHDNVTSPNIEITGAFVLAHIGPNGQVLTQQVSPPLVIGATEVACILGTDATDTLDISGISFSDASGKPDQAVVSSLAIFHAGDAGAPPATVAAGTICFSYSSTSAGEHAISVTFIDNTPTPGVQRSAAWTNGPLIVQWNRIDSTLITTGGSSSSAPVTFTTITTGLQFNVGDGTFLTSNITLAEFVRGSHKTQGTTVSGDLTGAVLKATITGGCGYFVVPNTAAHPTTVTGTSVGGRFELDNNPAWGDTDFNPDDLVFGITNDPGCGPNAHARVSVDVFYPGKVAPALPTEYVDLVFTFIPANKTPRIAWVGQTIPLTYAFSSNSSCAGQTVHFVRPKDQRGTFLPGPGLSVNSSGDATGDFGASCSLTVNFTSVDPGEADIEVFVDTNPFSKVAFPLFYLAFEDLTVDATPTSVVSTLGAVSGNVRGYFVGSNPSGRPAVTTPDGRRLPQDRWVLPDDWSLLQGNSDFRGNWDSSAQLPPIPVTISMQNETVVNNFKTGVKNGGLGYFIPPVTDLDTPETGRVPNDDGTVRRPRTFVENTDANGGWKVNTFGDLNLSFEGCAKNTINGNPECKVGDVVGHTTYLAAADYPFAPGKYPPIISNTATTGWTWAGYKTVTVIPTDSPSVKYVVAHLVDRDGFCDAASFNNVLGVPVRFEIDAGGGTIIEAADQPVTISQNKRFATVTTFDTQDDMGNPINTAIAKATVQDDECQAWIKVSNSLLEPTNVIVTFPAQPAPVPGDIRLTALSCNAAAETVTITNKGTNTVNLAGFALRSLASAFAQEEHTGLSGLIAPGQSVIFHGGPGAVDSGWIRISGSTVFQASSDYVRLVWNGFEISRATCDGKVLQRVLPNPLPAEGEGEIVTDIVIPFGLEKQIALTEGWNLLGASTNATDLATAFSGHEGDVVSVYGWNADTGLWSRYLTAGPSYLNTMEALQPGQAYWIQVKRPFTLTVLK